MRVSRRRLRTLIESIILRESAGNPEVITISPELTNKLVTSIPMLIVTGKLS